MPIIDFPLARWTPSDHAELARWGLVAPAVAGSWVQPDPDTGRDTTLMEDGAEYVALSQGGPKEPAMALEKSHWT